jgi:UrcA family protein
MDRLTASTGLRGLIVIAIMGALASSFGVVWAADASTDSVSVNVRFADLNMSSPTGALVLYNRIQRAADNACSYYWFKTDADQNRCVQGAIANAVAKVNHPRLFAIYNKKNKTPLPVTLVSQSR